MRGAQHRFRRGAKGDDNVGSFDGLFDGRESPHRRCGPVPLRKGARGLEPARDDAHLVELERLLQASRHFLGNVAGADDGRDAAPGAGQPFGRDDARHSRPQAVHRGFLNKPEQLSRIAPRDPAVVDGDLLSVAIPVGDHAKPGDLLSRHMSALHLERRRIGSQRLEDQGWRTRQYLRDAAVVPVDILQDAHGLARADQRSDVLTR
jgi:hypothetical protein